MQGVNDTFPGRGEVRLQGGYEWDKDSRRMGAPVMSDDGGHGSGTGEP